MVIIDALYPIGSKIIYRLEGLICPSMNINAKHAAPHANISSAWERRKIFPARNAEALRWKGYYPLLRLWGEYPNGLRAGPAAAVKSAVTPLLVLKEVPVDMNENPFGVNGPITVLWNR